MAKCNWNQRARNFAEREVGCPLTHCVNGHHVDDNSHGCQECTDEGLCVRCGDFDHPGKDCDEVAQMRSEIENAERAAGWDPNP